MKNPSYSTEDLLLLWRAEKYFLKELLAQEKHNNATKFQKMVKKYLADVDYDA